MKTVRTLFLSLGALVVLSVTSIFAEENAQKSGASSSPTPTSSQVEAEVPASVTVESAGSAAERATMSREAKREREWRHFQKDRVIFKWGHDAVLPAGDEADDVGSIFGSVQADGKVHGDAWAVFGPVFLGDLGSADGNVVAVFGNVRVNGPVNGNVVSVLGGVELGPLARVKGQVVSVGAPIYANPDAFVREGIFEVGAWNGFPKMKGFQAWVRHAFLLGRPLALHPDLAWAWSVAGLFLCFYLFIALLMGRPLVVCAETLEERPGKTILAAFLSVLFAPLLLVVSSVTIVGVPLLILAIAAISLIGKAAFLCWFGRRVTLSLGIRQAAPAVLVGGLLLLVFYLTPFLGFVVMKVTDAIGVGMVVYALMLSGRREKPVTTNSSANANSSRGNKADGTSTASSASADGATGFTAVPPPPPFVPPAPPAPVASSESPSSGGSFAAMPAMGQQQTRVSFAPVPPIAVMSALPRAGFGIRLGALLIDSVIFMIALIITGEPSVATGCMTGYLAVLWGLKGTTIGGIICGLKIVRLDDRPLDWPTALVRALAGFLSMFPAGLGFIWVAFDEEKQSWHDKVAGTVVVHAPKGMSLV